MSSKRGVVLDRRAREIVYNVNKFCENEKNRANELLRNLTLAGIQCTIDGDVSISGELYNQLEEFLKSSVKATERVSLSTGVNKNTVSRIRRERTEAEAAAVATGASISDIDTTPKKRPRGKKVVMDDYELCALGKIINAFYVDNKEVPTINKIFVKVQDELNFQGSKTTLRRIMATQLGYKTQVQKSKDEMISTSTSY